MSPRQARTATTTRLTLETIVDAAAELIDADGLDALTMRRLAERCGVGAMTLYGYVRTKEELLAALADRFLAEIERPSVDDVAWEEQVASIFRSVRHTFLDHPELARIVALQPLHGVAAYRGAEVVLGAFASAGLSEREAVDAFEALTSFTAGFTLREAARAVAAGQPPDPLLAIRGLPPAEFTHVLGVVGQLVTRDDDRQFEDGLALLIAGISARLGART
jgi:AcrR family transcriptional regulator